MASKGLFVTRELPQDSGLSQVDFVIDVVLNQDCDSGSPIIRPLLGSGNLALLEGWHLVKGILVYIVGSVVERG